MGPTPPNTYKASVVNPYKASVVNQAHGDNTGWGGAPLCRGVQPRAVLTSFRKRCRCSAPNTYRGSAWQGRYNRPCGLEMHWCPRTVLVKSRPHDGHGIVSSRLGGGAEQSRHGMSRCESAGGVQSSPGGPERWSMTARVGVGAPRMLPSPSGWTRPLRPSEASGSPPALLHVRRPGTFLRRRPGRVATCGRRHARVCARAP